MLLISCYGQNAQWNTDSNQWVTELDDVELALNSTVPDEVFSPATRFRKGGAQALVKQALLASPLGDGVTILKETEQAAETPANDEEEDA